MTDVVIRAEGISKRFRRSPGSHTSLKERALRRGRGRAKEFWPLQDLTFDLHRGEALGILGRNGAGKSTALKVLAGVYRPTTGRLSVNGRLSALLGLGAGFNNQLNGLENIRLNGALLGLSREEIRGATGRIIEFSGLEEFIDSPLRVYSSGMKLRLAYAIAIEIDPSILVIDEIIAVGDEAFQRQCSNHLAAMREDGASMIIASHAAATILRLCENALWLDDGQARMIGPAPDVLKAYSRHVEAERQARLSAVRGEVAPAPAPSG